MALMLLLLVGCARTPPTPQPTQGPYVYTLADVANVGNWIQTYPHQCSSLLQDIGEPVERGLARQHDGWKNAALRLIAVLNTDCHHRHYPAVEVDAKYLYDWATGN